MRLRLVHGCESESAQDDNQNRRSGCHFWALGAGAAAGARDGYGPLFDEGAYEQDGHIRIDFGSDAPFLEEDADLDLVGARHVEENVRQLVELTAASGEGVGRDGAAAVERAGREPGAAAGGAAWEWRN